MSIRYSETKVGDHLYYYREMSSGDILIYDRNKVVAQVDNAQEAREWIDEEFNYFYGQKRDT